MKNNHRQQIEDLYRQVMELGGSLAQDADNINLVGLQEEIRQLLMEQPGGLEQGQFIARLSTELASLARNTLKNERVAFLGPQGTFSDMALISFFGSSCDKVPQPTIPQVFRAVEKGEADYGIVPVENSTEGSVTYTMDELMETPLQIVAEQYIPVEIVLLSREDDLLSISKVYSHSQPLAQSKEWLRKNLPHAEVEITDSTTQASARASEQPGSASIGAEAAADVYNLKILARNIEDARQNSTRFFVMGTRPQDPTGNDMTSMVLSVLDRPGALLEMLRPFHDLGINMTRIESRPNKKEMWAYNFFIDIKGHQDDPRVQEALKLIRPGTVFLKILGSYPSARQDREA